MTLRVSLVIDGNAAGAKQAAAEATTALAGLQTQADQAARSIGQNLPAAIDKGSGAIINAGNGAKAATGAIAGLSFEAKNLGFQIVDVAQGALSGQSAFMILAQQGGQLAQVIGFSNKGLGGLMKELGGAIISVLTPTRLLAAGAAALGVAGYAVNASWTATASRFDDVSRVTNTTIGRMRELEQAASFKGISRDSFLGAMEGFAAQVYQARNNLGSLAELMAVNNVHAGSFEEHFTGVAKLVRNARDDQQRLQVLQQAGLPATMQWVRFLQQGGEGIQRAIDQGVKFGNVADAQMVAKAREFDERWNQATSNLGNHFDRFIAKAKGALGDATKASGGFIDSITDRLMSRASGYDPNLALKLGLQGAITGSRLTNETAAGFYSAVGMSGRIKPTEDPDDLKRKLAIEQQRISILGQTASALDQVRAVEIAIQQARDSSNKKINISAQEEENLKRIAREQALGITQIKASADAYRVEAETLGMSAGKAAAYSAAQGAINDARRQGRPLSAENIAAIRSEADALGAAVDRLDKLRSAKEAASAVGSQFTDALFSWATRSRTASEAINDLTMSLLKMAAQAVLVGQGGFAGLFGTQSGGGLFGGLVSLFTGGGGAASLGAIGGTGGGLGGLFDRGGYTGNIDQGAIAGVVHGKEFVVNAGATAKHRPVLEAINAGLPGFERGGYAGPPMPPPSWSGGGRGSRGSRTQVTVNNQGPPISAEMTEREDDDGNHHLEMTIRALVRDEIASPRVHAQNRSLYGLRPQLKRL